MAVYHKWCCEELAQTQIILVGVLAVCVHALTPHMAPVILLSLCIFSMFARITLWRPFAMSSIIARYLLWASWGIETLCMVVLIIMIMSDDWCRYFLYKGLGED